MKSYKAYLSEKEITPSDEPNTMSFWHGGDLGRGYSDSMSFRKGRYEYGPGLYIITHYNTAKKYSKGSRKLYMVTVAKGKDMSEAKFKFDLVKTFVNSWVIGTKKKEVLEMLEKHNKGGEIIGNILNNIIVNLEAIKPTNMDELRKFYVSQGVDYIIETGPFGWAGQKMMVLFNLKKIVRKIQIDSKDKIVVFDLPTEFN